MFNKLPTEPNGLTVFLSLYNEEKIIYKRLSNIAKQDFQYPLEILLVLDGCSDCSLDEIGRFKKENAGIDISIFVEKFNKGQASAQNVAKKEAKYNVLLKTDAETVFKDGLLNSIYAGFSIQV